MILFPFAICKIPKNLFSSPSSTSPFKMHQILKIITHLKTLYSIFTHTYTHNLSWLHSTTHCFYYPKNPSKSTLYFLFIQQQSRNTFTHNLPYVSINLKTMKQTPFSSFLFLCSYFCISWTKFWAFLHFPCSRFKLFTNLEIPIWIQAFFKKPKNHHHPLR